MQEENYDKGKRTRICDTVSGKEREMQYVIIEDEMSNTTNRV